MFADSGCASVVIFDDEFVELAYRLAYLESIDVLCVPEREAVAHGRYFIEGCVAGVPVLVPDICVFPELADKVWPDLLFYFGDDADQVVTLAELLTGSVAEIDLRSKAETFFDITNNAKMIYKHFKTVDLK